MNVLLVGSGGREHALAWKLRQSPLLATLITAPGNPGTAQHGRNVAISVDDFAALVALAQREAIDLVVVGPDNPLAAGIVDYFQAAGIAAFGPTAAAAQIESSKSFAKAIMADANVPTATAHSFDSPEAAAAFVRTSDQPWVVKADGLALGKGVIIPGDVPGTLAAITQLGATTAGQRLVLEERLEGHEVSVIALCDGRRLLPLAPARDHKRLRDGDQGSNTGGMGVFAPVADVPPVLYANIVSRCMQPVVDVLRARGTPFVGVLYGGVILTADGPKVLEFNARFGDPEAQVLLPLTEGDLLAALVACVEGRLHADALSVRPGAAVCVVLAAAGYPDQPRKGDVINGVDALPNDALLFHAGTAQQGDHLVTAGGRVLGVTSLGATQAEARQRAYAAAAQIDFADKQYRTDIGVEREA